MTEIKLNDKFLTEVETFRASSEALDSVTVNSVSAGGLSLPTVDAYQERLFKIRIVMIKFEFLTRIDAENMDALATRLRTADLTGD